MSDKNERFVVSARKYRPLAWEEVIGQEAITDTLKNSIEQDHMAHAYLFCGPRGVGKTTCARIFAKEINRSEAHHDEDFSFNIFELDAASNNKVDDIRNLTDQVRIPPQVGKYKVYIIDEVHMLSTQAFNAFLKTLEEPPEHAIFILATTEKHKIIPTILSRCQIYDFNRIPVEEIVSHLSTIVKKEKIKAEEEALHVIAQKADGALRDALSIFDQLVSFTNGNLTYVAVLKNLHVLDYDYYFKLIDQLYGADYASALMLLDEVLKLGFDAGHFISGLGSHLRDLLVCQDAKTVSLLEVGNAVKGQYAEQAKSIDSAWLLASLKESQNAEFKIKGAINQRLLLEVTLLGIANLSAEKKNSNAELSEAAPRIKEPQKPLSQSTKKPVAEKKEAETEPKSTEVQLGVEEPEVEIQKPADPKPQAKSTEEIQAEPTEDTPADATPESSTAETSSIPEQISEDPSPTNATAVPSQKRRTRKRPSTISLKVEDDTKDETVSVADVIADNPVTDGIPLVDAWVKALDHFKRNKFNAFHTILNRIETDDLNDAEYIEIVLQHDLEQKEFELHSADLLQEIRTLTGNPSIQITTKFGEVKTDAKLFRPQDKFEHLAKKNPLLIKLRKELDLEIEH